MADDHPQEAGGGQEPPGRNARPLDSFIDPETRNMREAALQKLDEAGGGLDVFAVPNESTGSFAIARAGKLTPSFTNKVLERVIPKEDNEAYVETLRRVQRRLSRVGMAVPSITVRYDKLTCSVQTRVGDTSVPTLTGVFTGAARSMLGRVAKANMSILDSASGILRPGRFTLLLGPPSSGRSTFMRAMVGQPQHGVKTEGSLTYNGETLDRFVPQRAASYIHQHDNHYGEMTVRETIEFAARTQSSGYEAQQLADLVARERELGIMPDPELDAYMKASAFGTKNNLIVELVLRLIGLDHVAETLVGNAMLRGISGGQKKRLGLGEALVGRARVLMADEISTGLDSNTTYSISKTLRDSTHVFLSTTVVALLQPAPETAALFDDILLISSGIILWHGPADGALDLFASAGLNCPPRLGAADFLQLVMIPSDQQRFWSRHGQPYRYVTSREVADLFEKSETFAPTRAELDSPDSWLVTGEVPKFELRPRRVTIAQADVAQEDTASALAASLPRHRYGAPMRALIRANVNRARTLELRNVLMIVVRLFQVTFAAFITATLFINTKHNTIANGNSLLGALFFSLLIQFVSGFAELQTVTSRIGVLYKQRDANYYPPWTFVVGTALFRIPFAFLDATVYSLIAYFAIGLDRSVRFFVFWLIMFVIQLWAISMFQVLAAIFQKDTKANAMGAFFLLVFFSTSGFIINKNAIPDWWIGAYWANPWSYVVQSVAINEFRSGQWQHPNQDDPTNPLTLGQQILAFWTFHQGSRWVWIGLGTVLISLIINNLGYVAALTYMPPLHGNTVVSNEELEELAYSRVPGDSAPPPEGIKNDIASGAIRFARRNASSAKDLAKLGEVEGGDSAAVSGGKAVAVAPAQASGSSGGSEASLPGAKPSPALAAGESTSSALPFEPLSMTFKNIEYSVPVPPGMDTSNADVPTEGPHAGALRLLYGINGALVPGVLTALMGASGAGKTTLMDVLAGRKTGGTITGDIRINGFPKQKQTFSRISGYVEQTDVHVPQMTVRESLDFSALLRLPRTVSSETAKTFVSEIMDLVELTKLGSAHVGTPGESGLSIQQRKRLTIAVELVANPSIIFLDEPTTGLDARAASIVMSTVRAVVNTGRTVACTIHQPSLDIFEEFDELLLLKPGGRCIFAGSVGRESKDLISYFQSIPGVVPIRTGINPADWMLEQTNPGNEKRLDLNFSEVFAASTANEGVLHTLDAAFEPAPGAVDLDPLALRAAPIKEQIIGLLKRLNLVYWRSPDYNVARAVVTLLVAFVIGSLCWRQGRKRDTASDVLNVAGLLYLATLFLGWTNCTTIMPVISMQREVMYRERAAGMYGPVSFGVAQGLIELPYILIQTVVYSNIVYWMVAFIPDASKFFWFAFFQGLTLVLFTSFGIMCVNMTPDQGIAILFSSLIFLVWNILAGFLQPAKSIKPWWIWWAKANPVYWTLYGLVTSQLGNLDNEYIIGTTGSLISIPDYLESLYGYKYSLMHACVGILLAFIVVFRASSLLALAKLNFQSR